MHLLTRANINKRISDLRRVWIVRTRFKTTNVAQEPDNPIASQVMKVLNVAEKNDAAKGIAGYLSRGGSQRREGLSVYNKIYEFDTQLWGQQCKMIMTSVSGHLLNYEFVGGYRSWQGCNPLSLFEAPVVKQCEENFMKIKRTLEREAKSCQALIIWTDCDREGENIGFEVIQVCQSVKPNIKIYRAKFSEITAQSVFRALHNLAEPNKAVSDAVDVRSELDLRIGAAFTRFQTLRLQKVFPRTLAEMLISYGSCQFPTLGFVVERFLAIERFKPEPFWKIQVMDVRNEISVEFRWDRNRLFERLPCQIFLDMCLESPDATVEKVTSKPKSKWRPLPLDTVELAKLGSRKLKLNAKETMKIAEKLYTQGIISYPRTETNIFPKELNLVPLVEQQTPHPQWGPFAQRVLQHGPSPRQGKKNDGAHPPIHPTKYITTLGGNEARLYEFIVRYFLACVSKDAEGQETIVYIDIAAEKFIASGLRIFAKNYLEVYPYETWAAKEIHAYEEGQTFRPTSIEMISGETSAPNLLTEADLIALMDKHGIGTDATHAEHIEKIKSRQYVGLKDQKYFIPGKLGMGLVMGYDSMGFYMSKPTLRAGLENDLKLICDGVKLPADVLRDQISKYKTVYTAALARANLIDNALAHYLDEAPAHVEHVDIANPVQDITIFKCPKCGNNMTLRDKRNGPGKYIGCMAYPTCSNSIWFPPTVEGIEVLNNKCERCPGNMPLLKFTLRRGSFLHLGTSYTSCIGGCDTRLNETLNIQKHNVRNVPQADGHGTTAPATSNSRTNSRPQNTQRPASSQTYNARGNDTIHTDSEVSSWNSSSTTTRTRQEPRGSLINHNQRSMNTYDDTILCNCHERAKQLTVRKEGANQGKLFYKCAKELPNGCDFFLWAGGDTIAGGNSSRNDDQPSWNGNANTDSGVSSLNSSSTTTRTRQEPRGSLINHNQRSMNSYDDTILCNCHERAKQLTVRKEGANQGRLFYKCAKPLPNGCDFFLWAGEDAIAGGNSSRNDDQPSWNGNANSSNQTRPRQNVGSRNNRDAGSSSGSVEVLCTCGQPARKLTVHKEGSNKGKEFYGCPKGSQSTCNFFKWADDIGGNEESGGSNRGITQRGNNRGGANSNSNSSRPRAASKRKCGACGKEGHTRTTCARNRNMD